MNQNADPLSRRLGLPEEPEDEDPTEYLHDVDDIYAVQDEAPSPVAEISTDRLRKEVAKDPTLSRLLPYVCLLYTSPSPRDGLLSRMPSSA